MNKPPSAHPPTRCYLVSPTLSWRILMWQKCLLRRVGWKRAIAETQEAGERVNARRETAISSRFPSERRVGTIFRPLALHGLACGMHASARSACKYAETRHQCTRVDYCEAIDAARLRALSTGNKQKPQRFRLNDRSVTRAPGAWFVSAVHGARKPRKRTDLRQKRFRTIFRHHSFTQRVQSVGAGFSKFCGIGECYHSAKL